MAKKAQPDVLLPTDSFGSFRSSPAILATAVAVFIALVAPRVGIAQICGDFDDSGTITATDTLRHLRVAVGIDADLSCPRGVSCWDLDEDGECDPDEDVDESGGCDVSDCRAGADAEAVAELQEQLDELEVLVAGLFNRTSCMSASPGETVFEGCNVHIRSGSGATDGEANGLGNLIVGYNEPKVPVTELTCDGVIFGVSCSSNADCDPEVQCLPSAQTGGCDTGPRQAVCFSDEECDDGGTCVALMGETPRSGSHNIVLGTMNSYESYGGIVNGNLNRITAPYASVIASSRSNATGDTSGVFGGRRGNASGSHAAICGGEDAWARGTYATVLGGTVNQAAGRHSTVTGGTRCSAIGGASSVSGGLDRIVRAPNAWAAGSLLELDGGAASTTTLPLGATTTTTTLVSPTTTLVSFACDPELDAEDCEQAGGVFGRFGLAGNEFCLCRTTDFGDSCSDASDCEGDCIGEDFGCSQVVSGACSEFTTTFGCYCTVVGGSGFLICVD